MIRPLQPTDIPALAAALSQMNPWRRLGFSDDGLAGYLARADVGLTRMVVERDGVAVAVLALRSPWLRGPYVELLAVVPEHQGHGVGAQLLAWAAGQGGGNLWVCVSSFNARARQFYVRNGFAPVASLSDLVASGTDEILMRRKLR